MGIKTDIVSSSIEDEVARSYALNLHCEDTGNVWIPANSEKFGYHGTGVIVNASSPAGTFCSSLYGRMERRAAFVLEESLKRKCSPVRVTIPDYLEESQVSAIELALSNPSSCIIGGPGTGKTTIAKVICSAHSVPIGLSPTGKGADRLSESIEASCYTIHRLYYNTFVSDNDEKLITDWDAIDLILCDEMGMTGTDGISLLAMIVHKAKNARLVFIGDSGQLPSIAPGCVLSELSKCLPTAVLKLTFRFDDYHIGMACESARRAKLYNPSGRFENYEFFAGSDQEIVISLYKKYSAEFGSSETRLITYHTRDAWQINRRMALCSQVIPVVCDKNNYRLGVFNGQTGIMHFKRLIFDQREIVAKSILWSYAFASTCHKAQGGQWDCVIVWIPNSRYICPQWLNTALSRAVRKLVVVLGTDSSVVESSLKQNAKRSVRISLLADFVTGRAKWLTA